MTKIVINETYGGFSLSKEQAYFYGIPETVKPTKIGNQEWFVVKPDGAHFERTDPKLVAAVETNLPDAYAAKLVVKEIPDNAKYIIIEHYGFETIYWSNTEICRA